MELIAEDLQQEKAKQRPHEIMAGYPHSALDVTLHVKDLTHIITPSINSVDEAIALKYNNATRNSKVFGATKGAGYKSYQQSPLQGCLESKLIRPDITL